MDEVKKCILALVIVVLVLFPSTVFASLTVTITDYPDSYAMTAADLNGLESSISSTVALYVNTLGLGMNQAVTMSTLVGYPLGDASISGGLFDHFYVGASVNVALANTQGLSSYSPDSSIIPGGLAHPTLYFGFSLGKGLDLAVKLMWYDDIILVPPLDLGYIALTGLDIYHIGVMLRWNVVKRKKIFPGLLEFAGLTLNVMAHGVYGNLSLGGSLSIPSMAVVVNSTALTASVQTTYNVSVSWFQIYGAVEAVAYLDFLWIFDLYLGIGLTGGSGYTDVTVTFTGLVESSDAAWVAVSGGPEMITIDVASRTRYIPAYLVPYMKIGMEVNLFVIRLTVEGIVNMWNFHDVGIQAAFRTQW